MKNVVGWKLYYNDGRVISSCDSTWQEARSEGVQILIVYYEENYRIFRNDWRQENYRDMYFGKDYYWQYGNGQASDVPDVAEIKLGKEMDTQDWRRLYNRALNDTIWP